MWRPPYAGRVPARLRPAAPSEVGERLWGQQITAQINVLNAAYASTISEIRVLAAAASVG